MSHISGGGGGRTVLIADTTYYVSTTGSDSTGNGSSGNPWATPQHAIDTVAHTIDANGFWVGFSFADGTYQGPFISALPVNAQGVLFFGDTADQTKVVFTDGGTGFAATEMQATAPGVNLEMAFITFAPAGSGSQGFECDSNYLILYFYGCKFQAPAGGTSGACLVIFNTYSNYNFGFDQAGAAGFQSLPSGASTVVAGHWGTFIGVYGGSNGGVTDNAVVMSGTPAFSNATVDVSSFTQNYFTLGNGGSFSGAATGKRFNVGPICGITGTGSLTAIPGNSAGTVAPGGFYS